MAHCRHIRIAAADRRQRRDGHHAAAHLIPPRRRKSEVTPMPPEFSAKPPTCHARRRATRSSSPRSPPSRARRSRSRHAVVSLPIGHQGGSTEARIASATGSTRRTLATQRASCHLPCRGARRQRFLHRRFPAPVCGSVAGGVGRGAARVPFLSRPRESGAESPFL